MLHFIQLLLLLHSPMQTKREELRDLAVDYAWTFMGTFYSWGGDDPELMDCSGLCVEVLKSVGLIDRKSDFSAAGLFEHFAAQRVHKCRKGCLIFWKGQNGRICHVEIALNDTVAIGASGGGSNTKTKEDAIKHNAFVKIRAIKSRKGIAGYCDPFKSPDWNI